MATTELPRDQVGHPVQALAPVHSTNVKLTINASSQSAALPAGDIVRLASNAPCYFRFGTGGVTATTNDVLFPAGAETFSVPLGATHIAVIQDGAVTGVCTVTALD
jgi:hypothetical protein